VTPKNGTGTQASCHSEILPEKIMENAPRWGIQMISSAKNVSISEVFDILQEQLQLGF
jgi:hypothetical protein